MNTKSRNKLKSKLNKFLLNLRRNKKSIPGLLFTAFILFATIAGLYLIGREKIFSPRALDNSSILTITPETADVEVGQTLATQIFLIPQDNPVSGVDVILNYDPDIISISSVNKNSNCLLGDFSYNIDEGAGKVEMTFLGFEEGDVISPVTETTALADISIQALQPTSGTMIYFGYEYNSTTDTNIGVLYDNGVVDSLYEQPNNLSITVTENINPTPSVPPADETITIKRAIYRQAINKLEVIAKDSLNGEVSLLVYNGDQSIFYGELIYNDKANVFSRSFVATEAPTEILIVSSTGLQQSFAVTID